MKLVIIAQDIAAITFGLVDCKPKRENWESETFPIPSEAKQTGVHSPDGENVRKEKTIGASPEGYLAALDQTLKEWFMNPADIKTIVVITGPGSFTASRVSTTLANGLGFAWNVPVVGIENPAHLSLEYVDLSATKAQVSYAIPTYDRSPDITVETSAKVAILRRSGTQASLQRTF